MVKSSRTIRVALAGNPNSGKTTIFNALTGMKARTGNWPGVTVSRREGELEFDGYTFHIVDLPGTYSLTSGSLEEIIARNYLLNDKPDVVIDIIDSSNLERNLVLCSEIIELGVPIVIALNMWDEIESKGYVINTNLMSQLLVAGCIPTVASRKEGIEDVLKAAIKVYEDSSPKRKITVGYGRVIEEEIEKLTKIIDRIKQLTEKFPARWLAVKLIENDKEIIAEVSRLGNPAAILTETAEKSRQIIKRKLAEDPEIAVPDARYGFAAGIFRETVRHPIEHRRSFSDQLDRVIMSRALGLPIFLALMWLTFQMTFTGGAPLMDLIDAAVGGLGSWAGSAIPEGHVNSLLVDGVIAGVGGVLIFVPNIFILFLIITFLEEWGYMARAAFVMDGLMHKIGLHGKSFVPLLMGFGCNIPAIMATRTLETKRDRLVTMGIAPLMSCGARLPVYTLLIGAFFSAKIAGNLLFLIYVIGVIIAVLIALIFRKTIFRGATTPFVMELPPYRLPTAASVFGTAYDRSSRYVRKAGTIILAASILIWFLSNFPYVPDSDSKWATAEAGLKNAYQSELEMLNEAHPDLEIPLDTTDLQNKISEADDIFSAAVAEIEEDSAEHVTAEMIMRDTLYKMEVKNPRLYGAAYASFLAAEDMEIDMSDLRARKAAIGLERSFAGYIGRGIEPVLSTCGFDWKISIALFTGLVAKEIVVSTMGTIYSLGEADKTSGALKSALRKDETFNPLVAFSMMIFVLLYSPCLPAIAVEGTESGSWKWALFVMAYLTFTAWLCATIVYQVGKLLGVGI